MSIKITNAQLNNDAVQSLNDLLEMDINASTAFKLTRIIKEISNIVESKMKMEQKILDKWMQKDEDGKPVPVLDDEGNVVKDVVNLIDPLAFNKDMNDLMSVENEILFDKINFDDLELKTAKVKNLMKIDFLFE